MEHVFKLTDEQLNIVGAGLAELPFKVAQPVMTQLCTGSEPLCAVFRPSSAGAYGSPTLQVRLDRRRCRRELSRPI